MSATFSDLLPPSQSEPHARGTPVGTFIEVLPATKSSPHNGIHWKPSAEQAGAGLLTIDTKRARVEYAVVRIDTPWDGSAFVMAKVGSEGTDPESTGYEVFCSRTSQEHWCSCKGFAYGRGKPCKHIEAALALIENRWI